MKPTLITSAVSLAIGFAAGWMINSASTDLDSVTKETPPAVERRTPAAPPRQEMPDQPAFPGVSEAREERPPVSSDRVMTADDIVIPKSAIYADQAKWARLVEVLGLSNDQSKAIAATLEETKIVPAEGESPDAAYERMGAQLEKNILAILDPAQQDAFREFQQRSLENKIELQAQKVLSEEIGTLDLTPAQREQALAVLRTNAEADVATISPATRLTLSGSILPIGNEKFTDQGILLLRKLNTSASPTTMDDVAAIQRAQIKDQMNRYEGILTPAQLDAYRASLSLSLENLNLISPPE